MNERHNIFCKNPFIFTEMMLLCVNEKQLGKGLLYVTLHYSRFKVIPIRVN